MEHIGRNQQGLTLNRIFIIFPNFYHWLLYYFTGLNTATYSNNSSLRRYTVCKSNCYHNDILALESFWKSEELLSKRVRLLLKNRCLRVDRQLFRIFRWAQNWAALKRYLTWVIAKGTPMGAHAHTFEADQECKCSHFFYKPGTSLRWKDSSNWIFQTFFCKRIW